MAYDDESNTDVRYVHIDSVGNVFAQYVADGDQTLLNPIYGRW